MAFHTTSKLRPLDKMPVRGHCGLVGSVRMNSSTLPDTTTASDLHGAAITSLAVVNGLVFVGVVTALVLLVCPNTRKCRKTTVVVPEPIFEVTRTPTPEETIETVDKVVADFRAFSKAFKLKAFQVPLWAVVTEALFVGGSASLYSGLVNMAESLAGTNFLRQSDYDVLHTVQIIALPICAVTTSVVALVLYYQDLRDFSNGQFDTMANAIETQTKLIKSGFGGIEKTLNDMKEEIGDELKSIKASLQIALDRLPEPEGSASGVFSSLRMKVDDVDTRVTSISNAQASSLSALGTSISDVDTRMTLVSDAQASSLTSVSNALQESRKKIQSLETHLATLVSRLS